MPTGGLRICLRVPEPQVRERRGAGEDFPPREGALGRCSLQGQWAASPRVVNGMVVVVVAFGGGRAGVRIAFFRGGCARVLLLWLGQQQCVCGCIGLWSAKPRILWLEFGMLLPFAGLPLGLARCVIERTTLS